MHNYRPLELDWERWKLGINYAYYRIEEVNTRPHNGNNQKRGCQYCHWINAVKWTNFQISFLCIALSSCYSYRKFLKWNHVKWISKIKLIINDNNNSNNSNNNNDNNNFRKKFRIIYNGTPVNSNEHSETCLGSCLAFVSKTLTYHRCVKKALNSLLVSFERSKYLINNLLNKTYQNST